MLSAQGDVKLSASISIGYTALDVSCVPIVRLEQKSHSGVLRPFDPQDS
jgi:hypothetical protein